MYKTSIKFACSDESTFENKKRKIYYYEKKILKKRLRFFMFSGAKSIDFAIKLGNNWNI